MDLKAVEICSIISSLEEIYIALGDIEEEHSLSFDKERIVEIIKDLMKEY